MDGFSAQGCGCDVQVLGIGHLAAAVRVELARRGLRGEGEPDSRPLILACSDFANPASFKEARRLAIEAQELILFVCLTDPAQPPSLLARREALRVVDRIAAATA